MSNTILRIKHAEGICRLAPASGHTIRAVCVSVGSRVCWVNLWLCICMEDFQQWCVRVCVLGSFLEVIEKSCSSVYSRHPIKRHIRFMMWGENKPLTSFYIINKPKNLDLWSRSLKKDHGKVKKGVCNIWNEFGHKHLYV